MKNFYLIVSENDRKSSKRVNLVKNRVIEALKKYDDVNVDVHEGFLDRGFKVPRSAE